VKYSRLVCAFILFALSAFAQNQNTLNGGSSSGTGTVTNVATTSPISGGPVTTTGTIACPTCATTTNGGALSGTAPVAISAAGAVSCATCATTTNGGALSGTAPIAVSAAGAITCTTCLTGTAGAAGNAYASASGQGTSFDTSIVDSGSGGFTFSGAVTHLTSTQGSLTGSSLPFLTHTATWNNAGTTFVDRFTNLTCTNAATGSQMFDYQAGSSSVMNLKFNGINCTIPALTVPAGSATQGGLVFVGDTSSGLARIGANQWCFTDGTKCLYALNAGTAFQLGSGTAIAFTSSTDANGTKDTCIDRGKAKVVRLDGNASCNDGLGYRVDGMKTFVTADFTTAASTALQTITGLTWTLPASLAVNYSFHCSFNYSIATANVAVAFGVQGATTAPTSISAHGTIWTANTAGALTPGQLTALNTTTATNVMTATPTAAVTTIMNADMDGTIEAPSNASPTVLNIMVSTANASDLVTVKRGSYCALY
jgi:hypothetical protein